MASRYSFNAIYTEISRYLDALAFIFEHQGLGVKKKEAVAD